MKSCSPLISLLVPILFSCHDQTGLTPEERQQMTETMVEANAVNTSTYDLLTIEIGTPFRQLSVNQKHLYGKFFNDRAAFYVVENPNLYVSNTEVKELTLYFIDGMLCKKKYLLQEDISAELIKTYGNFRFKPLSHQTRDLSRSEQIVIKDGSGNHINEKLDRYQMRWDEKEMLIRYIHRKDSATVEILLEEELIEYGHLLHAAELSI